eukprot:s1416_g11.t1
MCSSAYPETRNQVAGMNCALEEAKLMGLMLVRGCHAWQQGRKQLVLQASSLQSDVKRDLCGNRQELAIELRSFAKKEEEDRQSWEQELWSDLAKLRKQLSVLGSNVRIAGPEDVGSALLRSSELRKMVGGVEHKLKVYSEQRRLELQDLCAEECRLEESLQASVARFDAWEVDGGSAAVRRAPRPSSAPQRRSQELRGRVEEISQQLATPRDGGWRQADHEAFLRLLLGRFRGRPSGRFLAEAQELLPHLAHEQLVEHSKWLLEQDALQAERQSLLQQWREEKTLKGPESTTLASEEKKKQVEAWQKERAEAARVEQEKQREAEEEEKRKVKRRQEALQAKKEEMECWRKQKEMLRKNEASAAQVTAAPLTAQQILRLRARSEQLLRNRERWDQNQIATWVVGFAWGEPERQRAEKLANTTCERDEFVRSEAYSHIPGRLDSSTQQYILRARQCRDEDSEVWSCRGVLMRVDPELPLPPRSKMLGLMAPRRSLPVQYHVRADANETLDFDRIVRYISFHGFCSIETDVKHKDACRQAVREARRLETSFQATPEIVIDGLLGEDGSARTAAFASAPPGEVLQQMDEVLSLYTAGFTKSTSAADIGVRSSERTAALLHEAGNQDQDPTAISEAEVQGWLPIFLRHQIMLILFLGPSRGTLELQPFDEEGLPMRLATEPGMLVALRADLLWRRYSCAPGSTGYALSCFLLGPEAVGKSRTPMAAKLDEWMLRRIEAAAEKGDPRWIYSLDHMYHKGEQFAVRGTACKLSVNWDPFHFSNAILSGTDFGTEVPITRWDHVNYYSPEPDCWRELKVPCKHTSMIDGLELFDSRFFRIAPAEVKGMDPLQRQILEVGYAALHNAGQTSKTLLQSLTAIYVASPLSEWMAIDSGPEESGGCAQRSAGTGIAGSIMSNRFSFVFGMNGPSVTFDTDASSGLVILDAGLLALDNRRNQASQSCCAWTVGPKALPELLSI